MTRFDSLFTSPAWDIQGHRLKPDDVEKCVILCHSTAAAIGQNRSKKRPLTLPALNKTEHENGPSTTPHPTPAGC